MQLIRCSGLLYLGLYRICWGLYCWPGLPDTSRPRESREIRDWMQRLRRLLSLLSKLLSWELVLYLIIYENSRRLSHGLTLNIVRPLLSLSALSSVPKSRRRGRSKKAVEET